MKAQRMILLGHVVHLLAAWTLFACCLDVMEHAGPPKEAVCEFEGLWGAVVACQVMNLVQHKWDQFGWDNQRIKHLVACFDFAAQMLILIQVEVWDHSRWGLVRFYALQLFLTEIILTLIGDQLRSCKTFREKLGGIQFLIDGHRRRQRGAINR